jgi:serine protease AprX
LKIRVAAALAATAVGIVGWGGAAARGEAADGVLSDNLVGLVRSQPATPTGVIVQAESVTAASGAVRLLGGTVRVRSSLINGVAATMNARFLPLLVRLPGIRAVTPDVGVAGCTGLQAPPLDSLQVSGSAPTDGPGVAVVDSGVADRPELAGRLRHVDVAAGAGDGLGHGTHVAGIVAADGPYPGVAPWASITDVRVTDNTGCSTTSVVLAGLQWIADHASANGIRVVNISLSTSVGQSARVDPIDRAVEGLWRRGLVVVASAGNRGATDHAVDYAPGNDPVVVTVGALNGPGRADFSSVGTTADGVAKPDLLAPGVGVVSLLADPADVLATAHPDAVTPDGYFRMSGTSMAAPQVAGAAAAILRAHPGFTPDQVKGALIAGGDPVAGEAAPALDTASAVALDSPPVNNPGLGAAPPPSSPVAGLGTDDPIASALAATLGESLTTATWTSATWTSATWTSATWTSASWTSATWTSVVAPAPGESQ